MQKPPRRDCEYYMNGYCKLGNACRQRHQKLPRSALPEFVTDYFLECVIAEGVNLIPRLEKSLAKTEVGVGRILSWERHTSPEGA